MAEDNEDDEDSVDVDRDSRLDPVDEVGEER